jgi:hypothetical protein
MTKHENERISASTVGRSAYLERRQVGRSGSHIDGFLNPYSRKKDGSKERAKDTAVFSILRLPFYAKVGKVEKVVLT